MSVRNSARGAGTESRQERLRYEALDMLATMAKLYPAERLEHTGADGGQEVPHLHVHVMGGPRPWAKG